jgi:multidrug efflux pump subunit AcrA (membrane-fusion protein)
MVRRILWVLVLGLVSQTGCGEQASQTTQGGARPVLVQCVPARQASLTATVDLTGEVVATREIKVLALLEGPISYFPWREGDRVSAGQKLVEIGRSVYAEELRAAEAALEVARARLDDVTAGTRPEEVRQAREAVKEQQECAAFTRSDLERVEQLTASGALPGEERDKARVAFVRCQSQLLAARERLAMLEQGPTATEVAVQRALVREAEARLELARAKLSESVISAPFDGIVTRAYVSPGDVATVRAPLLEMMDPASLVVRFGVPEARIAEVPKGSEAMVRLDAYPEQAFEARIERVHPEVRRETRTRIVEARILHPGTNPVDLVPGLFARVSVKAPEGRSGVLVPEKALVTTPRGETVLFIVEDGTARLRSVTTGLEEGRFVQILDGVAEGESVVVAGNENLTDGAVVRVMSPDEAPGGNQSRQGGGLQ